MSKKISEMPIKDRVALNDWFTILDNDDNNANKKAKVSAVTALTTYTATAPIDITDNVISIPLANANTNGYLSSSNWSTFYYKANTQSISNYTTQTTPSIDLSGPGFYNRFYKYTVPLTSLTLTSELIEEAGAVYRYETEIRFTTGETFAFTATGLEGKWVGGTPTFEVNKSYVIAIKNGTAAWGEIK